jgi:DNA ligase 1
MKTFVDLYIALDATTKPAEKTATLAGYFRAAPPEDAAWALYLLGGHKLGRIVALERLRAWATEESGLPGWLIDECRMVTGDLAEALALVLPDESVEREIRRQGEAEEGDHTSLSPPLRVSSSSEESLRHWIEERLLPLRGAEPPAQREAIVDAWRVLNARGRYVWNRLLTGGLRGLALGLLARAVSDASGVDAAAIAHRLVGDWTPTREFYLDLLGANTSDADSSRPYPFCLPRELAAEPETLGQPDAWLVEWLWDGLRVQLIRRNGRAFVWSRSEELVTDQFPDLAIVGSRRGASRWNGDRRAGGGCWGSRRSRDAPSAPAWRASARPAAPGGGTGRAGRLRPTRAPRRGHPRLAAGAPTRTARDAGAQAPSAGRSDFV